MEDPQRNVGGTCPEVEPAASPQGPGVVLALGSLKFSSANFTFQNCEEFYVKGTRECALSVFTSVFIMVTSCLL